MNDAPSQAETQHSGRYLRYLVLLILVSIILYPLPFLLIRAPHFNRWSTSPLGSTLEYGFTARNIDADVLIFGDSTALHGIDPRLISSELGVKAFNIPNVQPSVLATRDVSLNRYLRQNRPPRLIVFYFAPWNLDFAHTGIETSAYDGEEMLLRHGTFTEMRSFFDTQREELLTFPFKFYRIQSPLGMRYLLHPRPGIEPIVAGLGHVTKSDYPPLSPGCTLDGKATRHHELAFATVQALVARYTTPQTKVLVYIAPLADCKGVQLPLNWDYARIPAARPRLLPPGDVTDDSYYVHPVPAAVPLVTHQLVDAIRPLLKH